MYIPQKALPNKGNKFYNTTSNGGYSQCIQGKPVVSGLNVLCNCVGWACGRFNEIYSTETGYKGMKYPQLNCNAENFIERAKSIGLKYQQQPVAGGIMVWEGKGSLVGHVAVVEQELSNDSVLTSESGYNHFSFANYTRNKGNGNWGLSDSFKYLGCIINPSNPIPVCITPNVDKDVFRNQIEVKVPELRVRTGAGTSYSVLGYASKGYYNYYDVKDADGYKWYKIAEAQWIASSDEWTNVYPAKPSGDFFPPKGYFGLGDTSPNVGKIASFMRRMFPAYTSEKALGNYYGPYLKSSITEFQRRTGLKADGCVGPITLNKLKQYGFRP